MLFSNKSQAILILIVGTILSEATETKQQPTTIDPYCDGTMDKNDPRLIQPMDDEEIQKREWTNKLVVYMFRLIRLARLGIRQYKLKTKANTNVYNSDDYKYVTQI